MHIEKNVGEVLLKWIDALKKEVYNNAKENIENLKRLSKVPSTSTSRGPQHPLCVPKLYKYHQIFSVQRKAMCTVLGGVKVSSAILLVLHVVLIQIRLGD